VCCPSRATFWSGRHASNIPHDHHGIAVGGAWNNYEGLPLNYSQRIDQVMSSVTDYAVKVNGKTDWATGGHSENVRLDAWLMNVPFPYDINTTGGWDDEGGCTGNGSVRSGNTPKTTSAHGGDWSTADAATEWMTQVVKTSPETPFFIFSGMNIVHPPYATNEYWNEKIDRTKVDVPAWSPLMDMHPCDFQSSMLKGCTPSDEDAAEFYSESRRREIRSKYYAMIAEWDAMVGQYMDTVKTLGVWNQTVFIVTSDHGDMQMEHQQFYKMVPYDASASVPMVIFDGRPGKQTPSPLTNIDVPTQLIDIFPTILEFAEVELSKWPKVLDGYSLVPMMPNYTGSAYSNNPAVLLQNHPDYVVSQFHGDDIAMSWFLIVKYVDPTHVYKLIIWGTGQEVPSLLFELTSDPNEDNNLIKTAAGAAKNKALVDSLTSELRDIVDFPHVAKSVAQYGVDSFNQWRNTTTDWKTEIHKKGLRWTSSWNVNSSGSFAALETYMNHQQSSEAAIQPCRLALKWPQE
jgi:arylsulfatase K